MAAAPSTIPSPPGPPPSPRLRPVFLWVRQCDTTVIQVHCEDYDQRNRLRLTRTPLGWRALPRTETFDGIRLPKANTTSNPPARRRARVKTPRAAPIDLPTTPAPPPPASPDDTVELQESPEDDAEQDQHWNLPDIETHIPSHTIHIPQRSEPQQTQHDFNPTPLDNLLAVAELEFNQQQDVKRDHRFGLDLNDEALQGQLAKFPFLSEDDCDRDIISFEIPDSAKSVRSDEIFFAQKQNCLDSKILTDDNVYQNGISTTKDLFETISDAHYMPVDLENQDQEEAIDTNELFDSLMEKGCEDNNVTDSSFDKIAHLVNNNNTLEGDYNDEDEDMMMDNAPVSDIIHRLEQSLESPGQNSITAAQGLLHLQQMSEELTENHIDDENEAENTMFSTGDFEKVEDKESEECSSDDISGNVIEPINDKTEEDTDLVLPENHEESYVESMPADDESTSNDQQIDSEMINNSQENDEHLDKCTSDVETALELVNNSENCEEVNENISEAENEHCDIPQDEIPSDKQTELPESTEEMPTDLRIKPISEEMTEITEDQIDKLSDKSDEMPKDLSCHKRLPSPLQSPKRLETPRPASRGSDTIQSPQPSGIPAVPSSPELLPAPQGKSSSKSLFLETLLASPSPKMCFSSELTITKHQNEPLNLGKSRKSASPTVSSCSDDVKKPVKELGEPEEKKFRKDSTDEPPLQKLNKLFSKSTDNVSDSKQKKIDMKLQKIMEEPSPIKQLQMLRSSTEFSIPDPLLVPKDKFSSILFSPGKEIPTLLSQRPELRLPEAFAFPAILQDPDILVVSLSQLESILQKHCQSIEKESLRLKEQKQGKPSTPSAVSDISKVNQMPIPSPLENSLKNSTPIIPGMGADTLANDIDAATSAALNQMLWLPYLSQFEAAMACSQNADFLKALNSTMPPGYPAQPPYSDLSQMFSPQSRFMGSSGFPVMPQLEYNNQLEIAMWQEAMAQANNSNFQRALKANLPVENHMKELQKTIESQNPYASLNKHQQMRSHSAARTSPIAHGYSHGCNRTSSNVPFHGNAWPGFPGGRSAQQGPQFSPGGQRSSRQSHHQPPPSPSSSASPSNFFHNNNYLGAPKSSNSTRPPPAPPMQPTTPTSTPEQRPRISVKSLHNLLEPGTGLGLNHMTRSHEPEIGSSTHLGDESGHDAQAPLWHPLFGKMAEICNAKSARNVNAARGPRFKHHWPTKHHHKPKELHESMELDNSDSERRLTLRAAPAPLVGGGGGGGSSRRKQPNPNGGALTTHQPALLMT